MNATMTTETNGITIESLRRVRMSIQPGMLEKAFDKKLDRWSQISYKVTEWFVDNDSMDDHLVDILNRLKGEKNIQGALNALAIRMRLRNDLVQELLAYQPSIYGLEYAKLSLSAFIIDALGFHGDFIVDIREGLAKNPISGRMNSYYSNWYLFKAKEKTMFDPETGLPEGLSLKPGELGGTKLSLFPWEKDIRFNGEQKQMLRDSGSFAFRLIRQSREWWVEKFKNDAWYVRALEQKLESRASLKARVEDLVDGIMKLSDYDRLYFKYTFQISGRFQCACNVEGIAPQGSGKMAWELADAVPVTERMQREAKIDVTKMWCKTHKKGLVNTEKSLNMWKRHKTTILTWLLGEHKKMADAVYLEGLHEILTKEIGDTTHKMIGRDLTTNGVAIFSSNFRDEDMGKITNIAGNTDIGDSHQAVATMLGYEDRDVVKKMGITAGLFHGQSVKNIAKNGSIELRELISGLNGAFGRKWTYFNQIANYIGTNLITNMRTSTRMRSPEGWYFINQSYAEKTQVKVTFFSHETDTGIRTVDVIRDMPILFDTKGFPMNNIYRDPEGKKANDGMIKMSGAYANGVHMLDAWMLREVIRKIKAPLHHVHDNFILNGDKLEFVANILKSCHVKMWKHNYLLANVNYMIEQADTGLPLLDLPTGSLTKEAIKDSKEFLQP